jgi:hypothetical protein
VDFVITLVVTLKKVPFIQHLLDKMTAQIVRFGTVGMLVDGLIHRICAAELMHPAH